MLRVPTCLTCLCILFACVRSCICHLRAFPLLACLTCLQFLRALRAFIFLRALDAIIFLVPSFFYVPLLFTSLTCLHYSKCFRFLMYPVCLHPFYRMWKNLELTAGISKKEDFVFQNLDIFNSKLVSRKQPLWRVLKIVFRIPWFKFLKNTFEWIMCLEPEALLFQRF